MIFFLATAGWVLSGALTRYCIERDMRRAGLTLGQVLNYTQRRKREPELTESGVKLVSALIVLAGPLSALHMAYTHLTTKRPQP